MKILFISPGSAFSTQIETALTQEGHAVIRVDERLDQALPGFLRSIQPLWRIGRRIGWWRHRSNRILQECLLTIAIQKHPDLMLSTKGMNIKPPTLQAFKAMGIRTACWFPDNAANEPYASWVRTIGPLWDHFFTFDSALYGQVPSDMHARIHVIPFAVDAAMWDPEPITQDDERRYACDVCFVGAPYPERVRLLEQLTGLDVRIWGWPGWKNTTLAKWYRGPLNARESAKAYRLAKICVNTNIMPRANGPNVKTFEIAAAGGFQLTDAPNELSQSFVIGRELDTFVNEDDLKKKVSYWLTHEEERQRVAVAGHARCVRDHTLRARVRTLLGIITS